MSLGLIFDIAGSAMTAETMRLTTSANNLSNADVETGTPEEVYRAKYPIFKTIQEKANQWANQGPKSGVSLQGTFESKAEPIKHFSPHNPIADEQGFVYTPNINSVEEMANVISASRSYQLNVEILGTAKQLMQRTLQLGE